MTNLGRPTRYTEEIGQEFCERYAAGEPILEICRDPRMPSRRTVTRWADSVPTFGRSYARARVDFADAIFDEIMDIAEDSSGDVIMKQTKGGNWYAEIQHEVIQRAKLRVETRFKIVSKINPSKYGDRLELAGDQAEARDMSDEKLLATVAGLLEKLGVDKDVLLPLLVLPPAGHA